jgi:hypothetical protein
MYLFCLRKVIGKLRMLGLCEFTGMVLSNQPHIETSGGELLTLSTSTKLRLS